MAYIGLVSYDDGGRVQSLDGLGALYDSGRTRNLLGADLGAVSYDDGGRFRTLVGLGQEDFTDLPLTPPSDFVPIDYFPPTPSPIFDTTPAEITGSLVPPSGPSMPSTWLTPTLNLNTQSAPITGSLTPPSAAAAPSILAPTASALTSIFSGIRNIFSSSGATVAPGSAGKVIGTTAAPGTVGASWFSQQSMVTGLPNWGVLAGVGVAGVLIMTAMGGSGSRRRRNPVGRRRNGMELVLMGANPAFHKLPHWQKRKKRERAIRRQLRSGGVKIPRGQWPPMSQLSMYELRRLRRTS